MTDQTDHVEMIMPCAVHPETHSTDHWWACIAQGKYADAIRLSLEDPGSSNRIRALVVWPYINEIPSEKWGSHEYHFNRLRYIPGFEDVNKKPENHGPSLRAFRHWLRITKFNPYHKKCNNTSNRAYSLFLDLVDLRNESKSNNFTVFGNLFNNINPREYFGPNYKKVLQFWSHVDSLTEEQLYNIVERFDSFMKMPYNDGEPTVNDICDGAENVTHYPGEIGYSIQKVCAEKTDDFYDNYWVARYSTYEIIANVENPVFLPMFYS